MARSAVEKGLVLMRVVAILAAYNEERFIAGCLEHLIEQGVDAYLIDNESTDRTVDATEIPLRGCLRATGLEDIYRRCELRKV
jgi:hypothetical protein